MKTVSSNQYLTIQESYCQEDKSGKKLCNECEIPKQFKKFCEK